MLNKSQPTRHKKGQHMHVGHQALPSWPTRVSLRTNTSLYSDNTRAANWPNDPNPTIPIFILTPLYSKTFPAYLSDRQEMRRRCDVYVEEDAESVVDD